MSPPLEKLSFILIIVGLLQFFITLFVAVLISVFIMKIVRLLKFSITLTVATTLRLELTVWIKLTVIMAVAILELISETGVGQQRLRSELCFCPFRSLNFIFFNTHVFESSHSFRGRNV